MIDVLLDVNILGRGFGDGVGRTGIFRATEGLVHAMLQRTDINVHLSAHANWASELLLLAFDHATGGVLDEHIVRVWRHDDITDARATALIQHVVGEEAAGRDARRDRANLTLLNATARRIGFQQSFDVVHSLRTPLGERASVPARARAVTIHDLIPLLHPEWMYATAEAEIREIAVSIGPGDAVIANSQATANDVSALLGTPATRIFVTPFAADREVFHREQSPARIAEAMEAYSIPAGPYLLSVSTLEPRKNIPHLLRVFHRLVEREAIGDVRLVLTGPVGWKATPIFDLLDEHPTLRSRVVITGYVASADLAALYSGARGFVYPSLYEGFGLPVLEAMQCGTPVIASNAASLPEVVGDAGVTVDPGDADALSDAIVRLVNDEAFAADLSRRGLERAAGFSWERTADATINAYRAMLSA